MKLPSRPAMVVISLAVLASLIPLGVYWAVLGSAPTVHPAQAIATLGGQPGGAALVDVRPEAGYTQRHIAGAISLPLSEIQAMQSEGELPAALQGRTLYLVCDTGLLSAQAARHLAGLGIPAFSVRGGMQDWGRLWPGFKDHPSSTFVLANDIPQLPYRLMSSAAQAAAALAMLWVKPTYMLLSAAVSALLLRRKDQDLRLLGWGLLIFLVGEVFCAINYLFLKDNSYFAEFMHSLSMALAFGLAVYALLTGLDERLVHFSQADRRCEMLPVCGPCVKYQPVRCGVRRMAQLAGVTLVILAFIPLLSPYSEISYNTNIYTYTHYYTRPFVQQWFEARYSPLVAVILVSLALLVMQLKRRETIHPLARGLFCLGAGFFGFGWFRVALGMLFAERLVWATVWEELTELMFVGALIYVLWSFKHTLLAGMHIPQALKKLV